MITHGALEGMGILVVKGLSRLHQPAVKTSILNVGLVVVSNSNLISRVSRRSPAQAVLAGFHEDVATLFLEMTASVAGLDASLEGHAVGHSTSSGTQG